MELARGRVNLYLDLKDVDPVSLAREVIAATMARQVVFYDKPEVLKAIRTAATEELAVMAKWRPPLGMDRWVAEVRPAAVEIDAGDVTLEACREFHRRGIKVQAKVLGQDDRPEVWDRMIAAGVDWLQTDRARRSWRGGAEDHARPAAEDRPAPRGITLCSREYVAGP